ncbi:hypothetical protein ACLQ8Z_09710 [Bordetella hinzii]|uniref:N-acetyltransferase YedL n=1 Tax=Bordetella hinzii OH87 BAL007II TaxID=1331262 RepID=A0ABR4QYF4_9BORD|nr:hypothetical protein [Bordetella hinzii]KCB21870.1 hypothetical protein L544_0348 [Bordetella hinzii OH87 BAL007II]KCB39726.1 hypothetical protein L539_0354 [Bordetella hinzii 5132]QDJ41020.1 hypothetical protein CBR70_06760 [Bordetella hinzii]QDJ54493.1 hypothetical protein CBR72_06480 [Bordetella hinzii]
MVAKKFTAKVQDKFIQVLEDTCSPKQAAQACGISRRLAFEYKQKDTAFRAKWEQAIEVALDALLDEAYRRAALGVDEPVIHGGKVATTIDPETGKEMPLTVHKHSDRLLEVLLKFRYGEQMADRLKVKVDSSGLDAEALLRMPSAERAQLMALLSKYNANKDEEDGEEKA